MEATAPIMQYDPGGYEDSDTTLLCMQAIAAVVTTYTTSRSVFHEGTYEVAGHKVRMLDVLLDSGALQKSYISNEIVERSRERWESAIAPYDSTVAMADSTTKVRTSECVRGKLTFLDDKGSLHSADVEAVVWKMRNIDFILGLPDILRFYLDLFVEKLKSAREQMLAGIFDTTPMLEGEERVYSEGDIEEAPEDAECPMPVHFGPVLSFMEMPYEESKAEYIASLDGHIGPMMKGCQGLMDLFMSEMGMDRFVPSSWAGIKTEPLDLIMREGFPESRKSHSRPINPKLFEHAHNEFERLCQYMYNRQSSSPWASPLVIAPKATKPYIRFCGDYRWVNDWIVMPQQYIPQVKHEIEKAVGFKIFCDIDMTSAFHQFPISEKSSKLLAVQTPWGLVEPKFMPEGVSPATGHLQQRMMSMFADFTEWAIVIFDNILILAHDQNDAVEKMTKFLNRCAQHNIYLKMAKTYVGFPSVKFFGYKITYGKYELDDDRKKTILECPMPRNTKQMQSFLGSALFFKSHIADFSDKSALLHQMTRKEFSWDRKTWKEDFEKSFNLMKQALADSVALHFPDYALPWVLRVDASKVAVGAVLYQIRTQPDGKNVYEPISFASHKFSDVALKWDTFKQEAYACYFGIKHFSYYLRGHPFVLETDHANLVWIDKSEVPIVVRWRNYMQSFIVHVRHISGAKNTVADWLSRMHINLIRQEEFVQLTSDEVEISCLLLLCLHVEDEEVYLMTLGENPDIADSQLPVSVEETYLDPTADSITGEFRTWTPEEMFKAVHGGRNFHKGIRRTYNDLNDRFPGHKIPKRIVEDWIQECPQCQKDRLGMTNFIEPMVRHIKPPYARSRVGVDNLAMTPADENGNQHLIVIVCHFTKYVWGMPAKSYTAPTIASALFVYFSMFGLFDELWSDPGSDLMSEVVAQLNKWLGVKHVVSLVERHESNGVEGSNKQILRHMRTLVHDERIVKQWSEPTTLCSVFFVINDEINSETGVRPFDAKFGRIDGPYFRLPEDALPADITHQWVQALDEKLRTIRKISKDYQDVLIKKRVTKTDEKYRNIYYPGDLVLFQRDPTQHLPTKLSMHYTGPWEVVQHHKNDVQIRHLATHEMKEVHVERLKMYYGNKEAAYEASLTDADQYVVEAVIAWRGTVKERSYMFFKVKYADGDIVWVPWSKDLEACQPYETMVLAEKPLFLLRFKTSIAEKERALLNRKPITEVKPGDNVYVDLRFWDPVWYDQLNLPETYERIHVVPCSFAEWKDNTHKKINLRCDMFDETLLLQHYDVYCYGTIRQFNVTTMILVDELFCINHPNVLPDDARRSVLLQKYKSTISRKAKGKGGSVTSYDV